MQEVTAMKFNILVTTYEFIMRDRAKLSKVDWKYMIIDEAQRMKDRESRLARDLDRFRCQRRLLLTGTPLQVGVKPSKIYSRVIAYQFFGLFQSTIPSPSALLCFLDGTDNR